jgi:hypothetical protein
MAPCPYTYDGSGSGSGSSTGHLEVLLLVSMFGVALLALVLELPAGTGAKSGTKHGLKISDTDKHVVLRGYT